jgi:hypothetical protein
MLMRAFLGWWRGERRHCSMAAIPTIEEEDANGQIASMKSSSAIARALKVNVVTPRNPRVQAHFTQG